MEAEDGKAAAGYRHGPPWVFKGSALYQLQLVKAATARAFVPKDLRLVEAFGYTLGGMFLARYHDSPAGQFDELVVIAGIVWNPPTSCAWAARVLVNSAEACRHGRKEVGLPSHVAAFSETEACALRNKPNNFLNILGMGSGFSKQENYRGIEISEASGSSSRHLCNISLPLNGNYCNLIIRASQSGCGGRCSDGDVGGSRGGGGGGGRGSGRHRNPKLIPCKTYCLGNCSTP